MGDESETTEKKAEEKPAMEGEIGNKRLAEYIAKGYVVIYTLDVNAPPSSTHDLFYIPKPRKGQFKKVYLLGRNGKSCLISEDQNDV